MKKNNPKGDIKKEIIGEVVGFNKEETSEAANLVCNLTGDNAKDTMSFGIEVLGGILPKMLLVWMIKDGI